MKRTELQEHLLSIRKEQGKLTPEGVVDVAREETHPLHTRFEWDDTVAGEKFRVTQAQALIRSVRIVYEEPTKAPAAPTTISVADMPVVEVEEGEEPDEDTKTVRAWASVGDKEYQPVQEVVADEFKRKLLLQQAERDLQALKRKYAHLAEFADLVRRELLGEKDEAI